MQCRRCDFQNIPNAARCVRCGAALAVLDDVAVTPPRAGGRPLGMRMGYAWRRLPHDVSAPVRSLASRAFTPRTAADEDDAFAQAPASPLRAILLSIIPGLCQFADRRRIAGVIMFALWLASLVLSLQTPWMLGIAASIHVHAIVDAIYRNARITTMRRVMVSIILFLFLWYVAYTAVLRVGARFAYRMYVPASAVDARWPDAERALLLWTHSGHAAPFDLVQYNRQGFGTPFSPVAEGQVAVVIQGGLDLGTVIAVSGDTVSFIEGRIQVNGADIAPPRRIPGVPQPWPGQFNGLDITIDPGYIFLIPAERLRFDLGPTPVSNVTFLKRFCVLHESYITDRAIAVISPFSRMQRL